MKSKLLKLPSGFKKDKIEQAIKIAKTRNPTEVIQNEKDNLVCGNCGTKIKNPFAIFCSNCGYVFQNRISQLKKWIWLQKIQSKI